MTPQEVEFFRNISNTEVGKFFHAYAEKVRDYAFDSRNWKEGDTKESAALAARLIEDMIINKIRPKSHSDRIINQHE